MERLGKRVGENGEGMELREMGMHEEIVSLGGYTAPCHLYKAVFRYNISIADSMLLS